MPIAGSTGDVGADIVAFDDVVRRRHSVWTPPELPEITFRAAAVVPPMVLPVAPVSSQTPTLTASGERQAVGAQADEVPFDEVVGAAVYS